ncbi:hypothetical protein P1X14_12020 [Sphingomonas sp. AOB5]|uniref:hypothetical protein n=1 Tax=Sphingomonas sp. AOB5 TaxID=3034017 RepID=UPI0023F74FE6|nr:hypothetical protein [Sphingomonas sp. AOB5]MDF7775975.1 hypothetical protein [Sphingomonas sp. AOB5]
MVFDLRGALLKKEEIESARLMDFEFRLRARTMKLLGERLSLDLVGEIAKADDDAIVAGLRERFPDIAATYSEARDEARRQLIAERGDPTPHKFA